LFFLPLIKFRRLKKLSNFVILIMIFIILIKQIIYETNQTWNVVSFKIKLNIQTLLKSSRHDSKEVEIYEKMIVNLDEWYGEFIVPKKGKAIKKKLKIHYGHTKWP
jgi:hypothetical protein